MCQDVQTFLILLFFPILIGFVSPLLLPLPTLRLWAQKDISTQWCQAEAKQILDGFNPNLKNHSRELNNHWMDQKWVLIILCPFKSRLKSNVYWGQYLTNSWGNIHKSQLCHVCQGAVNSQSLVTMSDTHLGHDWAVFDGPRDYRIQQVTCGIMWVCIIYNHLQYI